MSSSLNIELSRIETARVVSLSGAIDIATRDELRGVLLSLIEQGNSHLVIDLTRVNYVDSAGMGAILGAFRRARDSGGTCALVTPPEKVRIVMAARGLERILEFYPSIALAVAAAGAA